MPAVLEKEEKLEQPVPTAAPECDFSKEAERLAADLRDAKLAARHMARRARYVAEDMVDDVAHSIKHHPLPALGIALGTGALFGAILAITCKPGKSAKGA